MELINVREIQRLIESHQREIDKLKQLLALSSGFGSAKPRKEAKVGKPVRQKKGKRGAITQSILDTIAASSKPIAAGSIRTRLVEKGIVKQGSTTVYAMLNQMAKKGSVKKSKSADGVVYSVDSSRKAS